MDNTAHAKCFSTARYGLCAYLFLEKRARTQHTFKVVVKFLPNSIHVDIEAHRLSCKRFNEKRNTTEYLYAMCSSPFSLSFSPIISQYIMANLSKDGFKFDPKRIYLEKMSEYICECMLCTVANVLIIDIGIRCVCILCFGPSFGLLSNETLLSQKIVLFANVFFYPTLFILKSVCVCFWVWGSQDNDIFALIHLWNRLAQVTFEVAKMIRVMVILVYEIANEEIHD